MPIKGMSPRGPTARACPGKKFAQVEFVALTAALFRDHRADAGGGGERRGGEKKDIGGRGGSRHGEEA